jgi:type II secretory pathway component PulJ
MNLRYTFDRGNGATAPAAHGSKRRRSRRPRSAAFTLLEILLATALSFVLLATLWGLFGLYTNLFDKGQQRVESSQLVRSLMQQISDDLRAAIQDPIAGAPEDPAGQPPERRFGLFGSPDELRFDVLQLTPLRANVTPVGDGRTGDEAATPARVPELRTVHYRMLRANSLEDSGGALQTGLIRSELDFESPMSESEAGAIADLGGELEMEFATGDPDGVQPESRPAVVPETAVDDSTLWVPEVADVAFRFFDGSSWTSSWNSIQRKSLPVAVEVTLHMARDGSAATAEDLPVEEVPLDETETETAGAAASQFVHRLVVDLPGSPSYRKPRVVRAEPEPAPRPAVRRIAPPRWTPRAQSSRQRAARGPDQWIRRGEP